MSDQCNKLKMIENIIEELLEIRGKPNGEHADLSDYEVLRVCQSVRQLFSDEDTILLRLEGPLIIVGDLHGQFQDLLQIFEKLGFPTDDRKYLFLGDYIDRGENSVEVITFLFCLKIKYPQSVFLLRGNHEIANVNAKYGFLEECKQLLSVDVWRSINDVFNFLPLAAVVNNSYFCVHGGITPQCKVLEDINTFHRPLYFVKETWCEDLLWSDPSDTIDGFKENERGQGYLFGESAAIEFLTNNNLQLIIRSHELAPEGIEHPFKSKKHVLTVFSAPNYCGDDKNVGAVIKVTKTKTLKFIFFQSENDYDETDSEPESESDSKSVSASNSDSEPNSQNQSQSDSEQIPVAVEVAT